MASSTDFSGPMASTSTAPLCAICRQRQALYTCPACNLRYCSSKCYREPAHDACSESFYQKSLIEDITSAPDSTPEDKRAMLEILHRLQQSSDVDDTQSEGAEEEDRNNLAASLSGLEIADLPAETLLSLLSPTQRAEFDMLIKDPQKAIDLLNASDIASQPWWKDDEPAEPLVWPGKMPSAPASGQLTFNIVAVMLAYVHVIRRFGVLSMTQSGETGALLGLSKRLLPFVFESSTLVLTSLDEAITYVWSRAESELTLAERRLLLEDANILLRRLRITTASILIPYENVVRALLDFGAITQGSVQRKLHFYASWARGAPPITFAATDRALQDLTQNLSEEMATVTGSAQAEVNPSVKTPMIIQELT